MNPISNYILFLFILILIAYIIFRSQGEPDKRSPPEKKKRKMITVCPVCGSTDVVLDTEFFKGIVEYTGKLKYRCKECGFFSYNFPDMDEEFTLNYKQDIDRT